MKKFAIAGLISVLATIALSGCTSTPTETEEVVTDVPVVQEEVVEDVAPEDSGIITYRDDLVPVIFDYPADLEVEAEDCSEGYCRIRIGKDHNQAGYLKDTVSIVLQTNEYDERVAAEGGPYMPYPFDLCNNKSLVQNNEVVRECETDDNATSYFVRMARGDLIYRKDYYIANASSEWDNVQVEVYLMAEGYERMSEDESEEIQLNEEQLENIALAEAILDSLTVVGINTRGGGGLALENRYENVEYGFSLEIPVEWGEFEVEDFNVIYADGKVISQTIYITSADGTAGLTVYIFANDKGIGPASISGSQYELIEGGDDDYTYYKYVPKRLDIDEFGEGADLNVMDVYGE